MSSPLPSANIQEKNQTGTTLSAAVAIFCTFAHTARACPGGAHDILEKVMQGRGLGGENGVPLK